MYWKTLDHNGPYFYDDYLYKKMKLQYKNTFIEIDKEEEEFIFLYIKYINSKYFDKSFKQNFWNSWNKINNRNIDYQFVNLTNFVEFINIKKEKNDIDEKYKYACIDNKKVELVNYIVEPPGIFIGRGNDNKYRGLIKRRITSKDVIINISKEFKYKFKTDLWKKILSNKNSYWLSAWQHPVTNKIIYTYPSKKSINRMEKDKIKFDNAKTLDNHISYIRESYYKYIELKDDIQKNQIGIIVYLIDLLLIRVGSREKKNTFGISTLQKKHITFHDNNYITLHFLGKDSILYHKKFIIFENVYKKLKSYIDKDKYIFYKTNSTQVNKYLQSFLPYLTSKIFRTYHASKLFQHKLYSFSFKNDYDYIYAFKMANIYVAIKCNHRKEKPSSLKSIENMKNKIKKEKNIEKKKILKKKYMILKLLSNLNLSTSITNYIDPRIIYSFVKTYNLDIQKLVSKSIIQQIQWAENFSNKWVF